MNPLAITVLLFVYQKKSVMAQTGIDLSDVREIIFRSGQLTVSGGMTDPIQQISCEGSTCQSAKLPELVECRNVNRLSRSYDPTWNCWDTDGQQVPFSRYEIQCEGFAFPNDPLVLEGSCSFKYSLREIGESKTHSLIGSFVCVWVVVILFSGFCRDSSRTFGMGTAPRTSYHTINSSYRPQHRFVRRRLGRTTRR